MNLIRTTRAIATCAACGILLSGVAATAQEQPRTFPIPPDPTDRPQLPAATTPATVIVMDRVYAGWQAAPIGANVPGTPVAEDSMHLYRDANFRDDVRSIQPVTAQPAGAIHRIDNGLADSVTSMRWNLPPGVVVVLYENADGDGEQMTLWGQGEMRTLSRSDFNDKASSWAWYYAGGNVKESQVFRTGTTVYPYGTFVTATPVNAGSIAMFSNSNFGGQSETVADFTAFAPGELHRLPGSMNDSLSSMRWNLPPGTIVTFYQDASGRGRQASIWGSGEMRDVGAWDIENRISRWSWNYIGSPQTEVVGYVPPAPVERDRIVERPRRVVEGDTIIVGRDPIDLVARDIVNNRYDVQAVDLVARKNPSGEGTFVYVNSARVDRTDDRFVWMVVDDRAFAITDPAAVVTPSLLQPMDLSERLWRRTGLSHQHADKDAIDILFRR